MRDAENHSLRCVGSRFSKKKIIQFLCWEIRFYRFLVWKIFFIFFLRIYLEILLPTHCRELFSASLIKFSSKSLQRFSRFYVLQHQTVHRVHAFTFLFTTFMYIEIFRLFFFCVKAHWIPILKKKKNVVFIVIYHFTICVWKKACFRASEADLPPI